MKKRLLIIILIVILLPIILYGMIHFGNNLTAKNVENDISSVTLPKDTEIIEKFNIAGKLNGNGNGMQYFGAILIKSELSADELQSYYNEHGFTVKKQSSSKIEIIEHGDFSFNTEIKSESYYIVYDFGESNAFFENFDIRGH